MDQIETTFLGWFCKHHHPDLCHIHTLELAINDTLQAHFDDNKDDLLAFARSYRDLIDWDGSILPRVTVKITRPKWMHHGTQWTTRAIGLTSPKKFCSLLRRMVQEVDLITHHGNATFVDISMLYAGTELKHEYGKAVFKQIESLRTHTVEHIFGISSVHMPVLQPNLIAIDGILSVHRTNTTDSKGTWRILTKHDIPRSSLLQLDKQLATIHPTFDFVPYRKQKHSETLLPATTAAWIKQNKGFTATPPPKPNAWLRPLKTVRFVSPSKADDTSCTTLPTVAPSDDTLTQLQSTVRDLQNAERDNQKLRADFATFSESTAQALRHANQETQKLRADFAAYIDTAAQSLAQANERINELDHMVLSLLKSTASLTRDHQRLHEDFIDHAKDIDARMSSTETVTSQITTTLAATFKMLASLQTSVNDFQIQINASTETQISERCDRAVTSAIA